MKRIITAIQRRIWYIFNRNRFLYLASSAYINKPLRIEGKANISIGDGVIIQQLTWLAAVPLTGAKECKLTIGNGSVIGNFNHIYATQNITIGKRVLTADKVYISDCSHNYENIDFPIIDQPIKQLNPLVIDDGAWLGENVCVIGASVGKGSVVGANSVVTKNIPDYSIAVGIPARVIKRYNHEIKTWEKV